MKTCGRCGVAQPLTAFAFRNRAKGQYTSWCKVCMKAYDKERWKDKEYQAKVRTRAKATVENARQFVRDYLLNSSCVDCGRSDIRILEFDHVGVKSYNVTDMIGAGFSIAKIKAEIDQCEVRCSNCHSIVTAERAGSWRQQVWLDQQAM